MTYRSDISYEMVKAAMSIIADGGSDGLLDLTPEDWNILTGQTIWLARDRAAARRGLQAACFGTLDAIGMTPFELPAEFVAAAIAMFVSPCNLQIAANEMCLQAKATVSDLSSEKDEGLEPMRASQLFALVCQAYGETAPFKERFVQRTKRKMEKMKDAR